MKNLMPCTRTEIRSKSLLKSGAGYDFTRKNSHKRANSIGLLLFLRLPATIVVNGPVVQWIE